MGAFNTTLDFILLFAFVYGLHLNAYVSNVISTGICLVISFLLNKRWTFEAGGNARRQFVIFLVVTLAGLWGIQNLLIWLVTVVSRAPLEGVFLLGAAKTVATIGSLVWNYLLYSRLVFTADDRQ